MSNDGNERLHINNNELQHIARISHGKDSLKMLDVIVTRGLRLDRITTTDIWATDTIRGEHPEMVKFKDMADEYIWRKYRIEVEHLCAMRNGERVTYEKMFYHVPVRRSQTVQVERERSPSKGQSWDSRPCGGLGAKPASKYEGLPTGFPLQRGPWCQKLKHIWVPGLFATKGPMVPEAQNPRVFRKTPPRGAVKISWSTSASRRTSLPALAS